MSDKKDRYDAMSVAIGVLIVTLITCAGALFLYPTVVGFIETEITPGIDLKTAAVIAFVISFIAIIILAIASGDGLIGELQFAIPGFFLFYCVVWFQIAWVF